MNKRQNSVTVYDIAKKIGVSPATVSRVLAKSGYPVAAKTKERVTQAANELGYVARCAPKIKSTYGDCVAVVIPNLNNPYYSSLVAGLEYSLRNSGVNTLLMNAMGNLEQEKKLLKHIHSSQVLGVIISPVSDEDNHIRALMQKGHEVVLVEQTSDLPCSKVTFNYEKGGAMMTQYLLERGLRKIGFISSPLTRASRREVYNGYLSVLARNGLRKDDSIIRIAQTEDRLSGDMYEFHNGELQVRRMIDEGVLPEALFCGNDFTAIGALRALQAAGIRVPADVSVVGFDNTFLSEITTPSLTTIDQCIFEMGGVAAQLLNDNLMNPQRTRINVTLEPQLVIRDSVI